MNVRKYFVHKDHPILEEAIWLNLDNWLKGEAVSQSCFPYTPLSVATGLGQAESH